MKTSLRTCYSRTLELPHFRTSLLPPPRAPGRDGVPPVLSLAEGAARKMMPQSPCHAVTLPKPHPPRNGYLSNVEIRPLFARSRERHAPPHPLHQPPKMTLGAGFRPVSTFANYRQLSTFAVHFCSLQPSTFENAATRFPWLRGPTVFLRGFSGLTLYVPPRIMSENFGVLSVKPMGWRDGSVLD